jgi:cytochrome c553
MRLLVKIIPVFVLAVFSCSENQNTKYLEGDMADSTAMSALTRTDLKSSVFPHPDGFEREQMHGPAVYSAPGMIDTCRKCHSEKSEDPKAPKTCLDCHETYEIHSSQEFKSETVHGPIAVKMSYRKTCVKCHGNDLRGGSS